MLQTAFGSYYGLSHYHRIDLLLMAAPTQPVVTTSATNHTHSMSTTIAYRHKKRQYYYGDWQKAHWRKKNLFSSTLPFRNCCHSHACTLPSEVCDFSIHIYCMLCVEWSPTPCSVPHGRVHWTIWRTMKGTHSLEFPVVESLSQLPLSVSIDVTQRITSCDSIPLGAGNAVSLLCFFFLSVAFENVAICIGSNSCQS